MRRIAVVIACIATASVVSAAAAQPAKAQRSEALARLTSCRMVADVSERLACYDREVAAIDAAEARQDVVVVDREQLRKARRSLFGLTLPNLSVFGDDNADDESISRVESTIQRLSQTPYGKWIFTLPDGARWEQTDSRELPITPKVGHSIKIRKAAVGSYLANVKDQIAIRVRRLR